MAAGDAPVQRHYGVEELGTTILEQLRGMGKDTDALTPDDLAPVDGFHIRGRQATRELAEHAALEPGLHVLDVGCGLGGTCRFLTLQYDCHVTGIDLTDEYCRVAAMLSDRLGLKDCTEFRQATATDLPFEAESFDVVWTEHVQMNISDKTRFYGEIVRVLRPGGRLAFYDVFRGAGDVVYPVPWAEDATISHLMTVDELTSQLLALGLKKTHWQDRTEVSAAWFRNVVDHVRERGLPPVGIHLLMGPTARDKMINLSDNLSAGRITVIEAVLAK